jgi:hypothetical protein
LNDDWISIEVPHLELPNEWKTVKFSLDLPYASNATVPSRSRYPITLEGDSIVISTNDMEYEVYYPIRYQGEELLFQKTHDGKIYIWEVIEEKKK